MTIADNSGKQNTSFLIGWEQPVKTLLTTPVPSCNINHAYSVEGLLYLLTLKYQAKPAKPVFNLTSLNTWKLSEEIMIGWGFRIIHKIK